MGQREPNEELDAGNSMSESPYNLEVIAGLFRRLRKNPHEQCSAEFDAWEAGYTRGLELSGPLRERRPAPRRDWSKPGATPKSRRR